MLLKISFFLSLCILTGCTTVSNKATPVRSLEQLSPPMPVSSVQIGTRPQFLINQLEDSDLKKTLKACSNGPFYKTDFSIGHRGAPLQYPEHSKESYIAAAKMGAGILECDVTFTKDKVLVCRHAQCDLHTTTNILTIPHLAAKCSQPFSPADPKTNTPASAKCCTSDITLSEFKQLSAKMDGANIHAQSVPEYLNAIPSWRTNLYEYGTLLTHTESIQLFKSLNVKMTPELKTPEVDMPFKGMTQEMFAHKMITEYKSENVPHTNVFPQSFNIRDILYWLKHEPQFAKQAVYLDGRYEIATFNHTKPETWSPSMSQLANQGIEIIAPPLWALVTSDSDGRIVPSAYAKAAKAAGLKIIAWTLERSGPLKNGGGWYYQSIRDVTTKDSDALRLLDVLVKQVGVIGVFSDWPATTTYYANCMSESLINGK